MEHGLHVAEGAPITRRAALGGLGLLSMVAAGAGLTGCGGPTVRVDDASPELEAGQLSAASDSSDPEATQRIRIVLASPSALSLSGSAEDAVKDFSFKLNGKELDADAITLSVAVDGDAVTLTLAPAKDAQDGPQGGAFFAVYQAQFEVSSAREDGALPHIAAKDGGSTAVLAEPVAGTLPSGAAIEVLQSVPGSTASNAPASASFRVTSPATVRAVTWFSLDGGVTKILKHNHMFMQADAASFATDLAKVINDAAAAGTADADGSGYTARADGETVTVRANEVRDGQRIDPVIVAGFGAKGGSFTDADQAAAASDAS